MSDPGNGDPQVAWKRDEQRSAVPIVDVGDHDGVGPLTGLDRRAPELVLVGSVLTELTTVGPDDEVVGAARWFRLKVELHARDLGDLGVDDLVRRYDRGNHDGARDGKRDDVPESKSPQMLSESDQSTLLPETGHKIQQA